MIRLGGPVPFNPDEDPQDWIQAHVDLGYKAAYCPPLSLEDTVRIAALRSAAARADIVIAEVGAWSNPLSANEAERAAAINKCQQKLALAQELEARCCVNIAGSLGSKWDGPHPDHFSSDTFALIVDSVREIIDAVKPTNTVYSLEMMPWMLPDNADSYVSLIEAIDRKAFGVHLDPVNVVTSPRLLYGTRGLLEELTAKLGPWIKSCHAKDIAIEDHLTLHLNETRPGLGYLDYRTYLSCLQQLGRDIPLMLEHLSSQEEYKLAADYVRGVGGELGIQV